jgi:prepilin-type N-terminal cleavage/methylation domain-containing protein
MGETRKGFTIVELLVVALIVGILAAAAVLLLRGATSAARSPRLQRRTARAVS